MTLNLKPCLKTHSKKRKWHKRKKKRRKEQGHHNLATNLWSKASSEPEPITMRASAASRSSAKSFSSSPTATWNSWRWFCRTPLKNFPTMERGSSGEFRLLNSQWLAPALAFTTLLRLGHKEPPPPPPPPKTTTRGLVAVLVKNLKGGFWGDDEYDNTDDDESGDGRVRIVRWRWRWW